MQIFSYWTGPVTWIERLSAATAIAAGHQLTVFSYKPQDLRLDGLGVRVDDARDILCDHGLERMDRELPSHFSDCFRLEGLARGLGLWCDLDIVYLKQIPDTPYIVGREIGTEISNAVLRLPSDSPILNDYLQMCRRRPLPVTAPWLPWHSRARLMLKHCNKLIRGRRGLRPPYGPPALTHLVHAHHLEDKVVERPVYHPLDPPEVAALAQRADFTPDSRTHTIHLFGSHFRATMGARLPDRSSWLGAQVYGLGVN